MHRAEIFGGILFAVFVLVGTILYTFVPSNPLSQLATRGVEAVRERYEITAADNGKTFLFSIASRFSVVLDSRTYHVPEVVCEPAGILGGLDSISGIIPRPFAVRFEAMGQGTCVLRADGFTANIIVQ